MPATVVVVVVPEVPPVVGALEFLMHIGANRSVGGNHTLVADGAILMSLGINLSTAGAHVLAAAPLPDEYLIHTTGTNTSTGGAHTLAEQPPDESLVHTIGTNASTGGAHTIGEQPPNESLVTTLGTNTSTGGAHTLAEAGEEEEDEDDMALISTETAAASAALEWTGLTPGTSWRMIGRVLIPATDSTYMQIQVGTGAGPTWITTSTYDFEAGFNISNSGTYSGVGGEANDGILVSNATAESAAPGVSFAVDIVTDNAAHLRMAGTTTFKGQAGRWYSGFVGGGVPISAPITAFRLKMFSGNITSGNASLYSVPTS